MNYNIETGAIESVISVPICSRVVNCDVSEDITIPDGLPEVRRVLALKENILSPAKFVGAKAVDFSGAIDYTLIYLGTDGRLCSAPLSAEYSFSLPLENLDRIDVNEGICVISSLSGENSNVRISTPRRLQIRAGVRACVVCFGKSMCEEDLRGIEDTSTLQRLQLEDECARLTCESSDIVTLTDEYLLGEESRIIYSDASAFVNDARIDGEVVRASGEALIKLLIENGDNVERVVRRIPFEAETDLDELDIGEESVLCRATASINELDVSVEDGRARIEAGLVLEVCIAQNKSVCYTRDVYSTKQTCNAEYKKCALPTVLVNKNANITQSERVSCAEIGFTEGAEILDIWGSAVCEDGALENGRYAMRGKVKYKLLCRREGDFFACDAELPFKYEAESGSSEIEQLCARVCVMGARARCDGENLLIEGELAISASAFGANEVDMLSCASFGESIESKRNQFVVCFKSAGESLFELAKRYNVSCDDISGEVDSGAFVIIER